ncbi:MAG TPA: hypothetical protein VJT67_12335, partial [Longimicrobiaceae bacterium]|nr:hypothetical protein [Longimicrobiaceae bacterium]
MNPYAPHPRLRRAALLLAALLHLLGTAAGPVLHGWTRADPHKIGWSAERSDLSAPHDEQGCAICQAVSHRAVPEPGAPLVADAGTAAAVPSAIPDPHASSGHAGV